MDQFSSQDSDFHVYSAEMAAGSTPTGDTPRRRQTQSCDRCRSKKRRCDGNNPCGNCFKAGVECTMLQEQKKRGPKRAAPPDGAHPADAARGAEPSYDKRPRQASSSAAPLAHVPFTFQPAAHLQQYRPQHQQQQHQIGMTSLVNPDDPETASALMNLRNQPPLQHPPAQAQQKQQQRPFPLYNSKAPRHIDPADEQAAAAATAAVAAAAAAAAASSVESISTMSALGAMPAQDPTLQFPRAGPTGFAPIPLSVISNPAQNANSTAVQTPQADTPGSAKAHTPAHLPVPLAADQAHTPAQHVPEARLPATDDSRIRTVSSATSTGTAGGTVTATSGTAVPNILAFDLDFVQNFGFNLANMQGDALKGITGGDYIKPSAFNPAGGDPTQQGAAVPQPIQIDPEVLNLYSQINPKMNLDLTSLLQSTLTGVQRPTSQANIPAFGISPESFLYGPVNLTVPELPGLPSEFFLHLISMFFTYFHPTMPIVREISFFENLIPINHHHQMLLNAIYAIGCHYSRHPMLYQAPFYTPQRASDFFMDRAFAAVPPPDSKHFISYESLAICQASLLLATCDFSLKRCRTWMMIGMGCRLVQKYELYYTQSQSDFFTVFNGRKKVHIPSPLQERKRVWWGALLSDLFVSISTGKPLLLNETEYIDTMVDTTKLIDRPVPKLAHGEQPLGLISTSSASKSTGSPGGEDLDKWKPFFSGFPKDTIFGPSDFTSDRWSKKSIGFFQVNHLFSSLDDTSHLVQLCFIVRRILRFLHAAPSIPSIHTLPTTTACMYSLIGTPVDVVRLHESLLVWYENLPVPFRLFHSLEALAAADPQDLGKFCSIKEGERVSGTVVTLNLLLFSAFALLHQRNAEATAINFEDDEAQSAQQPLSSTLTRSNASFINQPKSSVPIFRISSSLLGRGMFESSQIIAFMYKAQTHLIKSVYGASMPPSPTSVPPSEMVGSPIIGTLMMPTAVALLAQSAYARKLVSQTATTSTPGAMPAAASADDTTPVPGIEPISQSVLPVLDNISQVWSTAGEYATTLRGLVDKVRKRINTQTAPSVVGPDASATTDPWYQSFQARTVPLPRAPLGPASLEELIRNDTARTAGAGKTTNNASQMSSISASSSFIESLLQPGVAMTQSLDASSRAPSFQVPQAPSTQSSAAASTAAASDRNGHPQQLSQKSQSLTASQSQSQSQLLQHISSALNLSSSRPRIDPVVSMLLGQSAGAGRDTAKLSTDGAAGGVSDGATRAAAAAQQASQKEPSAATQAEGASGASQPAPGAGGVPAIPPAVAAAKEGMAQSWHDLRSEFEDEFLL